MRSAGGREEREIALERGKAYVVSSGHAGAPAIVVVPPLGTPAAVLDPFTDALGRDLWVHVVELPGSGHASAADASMSTRSLARSLATVVRQLSSEPMHVFGSSLGALVTEWLAIDAGSLVGSLVLASAAASGHDIVTASPLHELALLARAIGHRNARAALVEAIASADVARRPWERERIARAIEATPRNDVELLWLLRAVATHDVREHLGRITAPTLVLTGADDELVPPPLQFALADAIPGAQRVTLGDAGHSPALDRPRETARLVSAFVHAPGDASRRTA